MTRVNHFSVIRDKKGDVVPGELVTITALDISGDPAASIYDAKTGGSFLANPIATDAYGAFSFWAEAGRYGLSTAYTTIEEIVLGNGQEIQTKIKSADESRTSESLVNDDDLSGIKLIGNNVYVISGHLSTAQSAGNGVTLRLDSVGESASDTSGVADRADVVTQESQVMEIDADILFTTLDASNTAIFFNVTYRPGEDVTLNLQWAREVATAGNTFLNKGSTLRAQRVL